MSSLINVDLDSVINRSYLKTHLLFLGLWLLGFLVLFTDLDLKVVSFLPSEYQFVDVFVLPIYIVFTVMILKSYKWYLILAFIFYPFLFVFWFFPKLILQTGKIYLLISYIKSVFTVLANFKRSLIILSAFSVLIVLILNLRMDFVRLLTIVAAIFTLGYVTVSYLAKIFRPKSFWGNTFDLSYDEEGRLKNIKPLADIKKTANETEEALNYRRIDNIGMFYVSAKFLTSMLSTTSDKSAFFIYFIFGFITRAILSILLLSYINYQLSLVNSTAFLLNGDPSYWEFVRYVLKSMTFGDIPEIIPNLWYTKLLEFMSFILIGVVYLIALLSFGKGMVDSKYEEENLEIKGKLVSLTQEIDQYTIREHGAEVDDLIKKYEELEKKALEFTAALKKMF